MATAGFTITIGLAACVSESAASLVRYWSAAFQLDHRDGDGETALVRDRVATIRVLREFRQRPDAIVFLASAARANARRNQQLWRSIAADRASVGTHLCMIYFGDWASTDNRSPEQLAEIKAKTDEPVFWDGPEYGASAAACLVCATERVLARQRLDPDGELLKLLFPTSIVRQQKP